MSSESVLQRRDVMPVLFRSLKDYLLTVQSNYGPILYHFQDKAKYWRKSRLFHTRLHRTDRWTDGYLETA